MSQVAPYSKAWVKAVFSESTLRFEVPSDIALEKLCALLTTFGRGHGLPLLVEVSWPSAKGVNSLS